MQDERKRIHFYIQEELGEIQAHVTLAVDMHSSGQLLGESFTNSGQEFNNKYQLGMVELPMVPVHRGWEKRITRSRPGWVTQTNSQKKTEGKICK